MNGVAISITHPKNEMINRLAQFEITSVWQLDFRGVFSCCV